MVLGVFILAIAWICFQRAMDRHTGILRTFAAARRFLGTTSKPSDVRPPRQSVSPRPQHSVHLSWKASTSAVVGYNVYRRDTLGFAKINSLPIIGTDYIDNSVQPGQTYHYTTKAVSRTGTESKPSNEALATVPAP
jgi:fibronectin type 3 domain-containing protein